METKQELQQELARLKELVKQTEEKINNVLKVGKWYHYEGGLFCFQGLRDGILRGYGFLNYTDTWINECNLGKRPNLWKLASPQEIEQALIKEAEKRYKVGDKVTEIFCDYSKGARIYNTKNFNFEMQNNRLYFLDTNRYWSCIFEEGKWAEIIPEPKIEVKPGIKFNTDESNGTVYTITSCNTVDVFVGWGGKSNRVDYKKEIAHKYLNDGTWIVVDDNEEPKIGDVCKFWDHDEDIFVIGKLNSIDTESQYKFVIADITSAPYYFINAKTLTQQQAIDLLFNS